MIISIKVFLVSLIYISILSFPTAVSAQSDYVLPYPGVMPGSKAYLLQEFKNAALKYWYFGDFGQFTYNLKQSDKYLVEAKTLFEYKQYLLAFEALQKSDEYFEKTSPHLEKAGKGKDIIEKEKILRQAAGKHIEILQYLHEDLPETFQWQPEKKAATFLNLEQEIEESIEIRNKLLNGKNRSFVLNVLN